MKVATNISSSSKSLASPANTVIILVTNAKPSEHCHNPESLQHYTIESIHQRAETVTPLLKRILDYCPPEHEEFEE
jgi:hypothetical protein